MNRRALASAILLVLASPLPSHAQGDKAGVEAAVRRLVTAANQVNMDRVFAEFAPNVEMFSSGVRYANMNAIRDAFGPVFAGLRSQNIRPERWNTQLVTPTLAVYTANGNFTTTDNARVVSPARGFAWTIVWRYANDGWKVASLHQSITEPLSSPVQQASRRAIDQTAFRQHAVAYANAINRRDASAVAALFTENGDQVIGDGPLLVGRAAIRADANNVLSAWPASMRFALAVTGVRMLDPNTAIVETTATFNEGPVRSNRGTAVMVKEGNRWLISSLRVYPSQATR
jgi:uncharacterized protein (TIGR02246 family)